MYNYCTLDFLIHILFKNNNNFENCIISQMDKIDLEILL
jgi:hypothetical protein